MFCNLKVMPDVVTLTEETEPLISKVVEEAAGGLVSKVNSSVTAAVAFAASRSFKVTLICVVVE